MRKILYLSITLLIASISFAQRGKDGDQVISTLNEEVNTYTVLTSNANAGISSISVESNQLTGAKFTGALEQGDLILVYQVQGGDVDLSDWYAVNDYGDYTVQASYSTNGGFYNFIEFGAMTYYGSVGDYEFAEVSSVSGNNSITLTCPLKYSYEATGHSHTIVVRIPRFKSLKIEDNASIVCPKWDGQTGGVLAIEVEDDLEIESLGKIDASETGFRGGNPVNTGTASPSAGTIMNINNRGYLGSPNPEEGSEKGESIFGGPEGFYETRYSRYGYGAIANGGGGGGYHNAGGGGGSNVGNPLGAYYGHGVVDRGPNNSYDPAWNLEADSLINTPSEGGGRGGYSHIENNGNPLTVGPHNNSWGGDFRRISGGVGGHPLQYNNLKAFMGGGGGAGHGNDGDAGKGGTGGGVVFLNLYGASTGDGTISSNGEDGGDAVGALPSLTNMITGNDGAGGAGGGGAVIIRNILPLASSLHIEAKGGKGGDEILQFHTWASENSKIQAHGPGGGGAGGLISTIVGTANFDVSGGVSGTTNSETMVNFPINGATKGANGIVRNDIRLLDIQPEDDTLYVCEGESITLLATKLGNESSSAQIEWWDDMFGGTLLASGNSYTTGVLTNDQTFYLANCRMPFRVPVHVIVVPGVEINGTAIIVDESCNGNDGSITGLSASGGNDLVYEWNGVESPSADLVNATSGSYTLVVTSPGGCSATSQEYIINAEPGILIDASAIVISDVSCDGNDGAITGITVTGGQTPFTFEWNGTTTATADLIGAASGSYTLTVTDDNGCVETAGPFTVGTTSTMIIDVSSMIVNPESCFENDGSISGITVSGGAGGFTYAWSNGTNSLDLSGLEAGSYTLTVTDADGCIVNSGPHEVEKIDDLVIDMSNLLTTDENCGNEDGTITGIEVTGGTQPYMFSWSNGGNNLDLTGLDAGDYILTVTDANGCTQTSTDITINDADSPVINDQNVSVTNANCGSADGGITGLLVTGGTEPYTYAWSNGSNSLDLSNVGQGSYTLTVTDANGCTVTSTSFAVSDNDGPIIDESSILVVDATCGNNDGAISGITISGGTQPYSYSWSNGGTSVDLNGLAAGNYTLTVTDANGCSAVSSALAIADLPGPVLDESNVVITHATCGENNGSITGVEISGGTLPYVYAWNGDISPDVDLTNIGAGNYVLMVADANGCIISSSSYAVTSSPAPTIDDSAISIVDESCDQNDGSISGITITGGTAPYSYAWSGGAGNTIDASNLSGGTYTLTITDAEGCSVNAGPYVVNTAEIPTVSISTSAYEVDAGEEVNLEVDVSPVGSIVDWSPAAIVDCSTCEEVIATPEESMWIYVTVVSPDGCEAIDSIYIEVIQECGEVQIPTVFSPNGDGLNDYFCVIGGCLTSMDLRIYNRWGELMFESQDPTECWDGTFRNQAVGTGSYIYQFKGVTKEGEEVVQSGNLNLIR